MKLVVVSLAASMPAASALAGDVQFDKNADLLEVRLGVASYDTGLLTHKDEGGVVINGEIVFRSPDFLSSVGSPRPYFGVDLAPASNQIDVLYAGLGWEAYLTDRIYVLASVGGSLNNADEQDNYEGLGSRALFQLSAGVGFDLSQRFTVQLYGNHFSNAGLSEHNSGLESTGLRFGYRF